MKRTGALKTYWGFIDQLKEGYPQDVALPIDKLATLIIAFRAAFKLQDHHNADLIAKRAMKVWEDGKLEYGFPNSVFESIVKKATDIVDAIDEDALNAIKNDAEDGVKC